MNRTLTATSTFALMAAGYALPTMAADDPWAVLSNIEIEEITTDGAYRVVKSYPAEIENGVEKFAITGYAVPLTLDPSEPTLELMLVADMGDCPFCGSSQHQGQLQVELDEAVVIEEGQKISVVGALELMHDPETWQAAIMRGAKITGS